LVIKPAFARRDPRLVQNIYRGRVNDLVIFLESAVVLREAGRLLVRRQHIVFCRLLDLDHSGWLFIQVGLHGLIGALAHVEGRVGADLVADGAPFA
jgi:hypothetical protein